MLVHSQRITGLLGLITIAALIMFMGGCKDKSTSSEVSYQIRGTIQTENQTALTEAMVSIDGIEAQSVSDANGAFLVQSTEPFDSSVAVTVTRDGFDAFSDSLAITQSSSDTQYTLDNIILLEAEAWEFLEVTITPSNVSSEKSNPLFSQTVNGSRFTSRASEVCDCEVNASGRVYKKGGEKSNLYVLLVVDASGSTGQKYIGEKSVFEVEIDALKTLVDNLRDGEKTYIGVISFATTATLMLNFTDDFDLVDNVLLNLESEPVGSTGATNYQAVLNLINTTFSDKKFKKKDIKTVAFVSDGIPTAPNGSGLTQEKEDRLAAIFAADNSSKQDIHLNTFPVNIVSKLTTMPTLSAMTDGIYFQHDADKIADEIADDSLIGIVGVVLENETTGGLSSDLKVFPDGRFSGNICLADGKNKLKITPAVCDGCEKISYQKINATCDGEECDACSGQVTYLKLKYTGEDASIAVTAKKGKKDATIFDDDISTNGEFSFTGAEKDKTMGDSIKLYVNGELTAEFKTSCGEDKIGPGLIEGDFEVVEGYSRNGGLLCPID